MPVLITERKIKNKAMFGESVVVIENIRYPRFESETNGKLCKRMNDFYSSVAEKYSRFAKTKLFRRAKTNARKYKLPIVLAMNYTVALCNKKAISVVLDLSMTNGNNMKTRRFSQMWGVEKKDMMSLSEVLFCENEAKNKIFDIVMEIAENNAKNTAFGYFENALEKLPKKIDMRNCFAAPSGMCFFVDAGILSPVKYGAANFVVPYDKLVGIIKRDFVEKEDEKLL